MKKFLSLFLAIIMMFSAIPVFADNETVDFTEKTYFDSKYKAVYESGNWESLYTIIVKDNVTGQISSLKIPSINGGYIDQLEFESNMPSNLDIISFSREDNENYVEIKSRKKRWVETAFDVGCFMLSLSDFQANPSFWTGLGVVLDGAAVAFPGIPAVGGRIIDAIQASDKLADALKYGINSYTKIKKATKYKGLEVHHIFEKRFAKILGVAENDIFSIALTKSDHRLFTNKMREKIPYLSGNYSKYTKDDIIKASVEAYNDLYKETGDEMWKYLSDFASGGQIKP